MWFEVLGPLQVKAGAAEVAITARREQILLAMLLLQVDRHVDQDQLVDAMWTGGPPASAAAQVHGAVYRLRKRLVAGGIPDRVIVTEAAGYRARVDPHLVDLWEFRRLRDEARAAAGNGQPDDARQGYRAALGLWHGSALAGIDSPPVRLAAAALDEERARALEECVEIELQVGAGGELVAELTQVVRQHPYRETLHGALMLALHRAGRQADALAAYRHARQVFHDELGTEPGPELQRLHQAILNRDPGLLGPHAASARPPAAGPPTPRELPADVAGFTGRAEAVQALDDQLGSGAPGQVRIVAIAGTAGVGKTALAVHWAHRVTDRFPEGQLYVNLDGYATGPPLAPIDALARFLHALGVPGEKVPVEVDEAAAMFRSLLADKRMLVVLDNAASVDQVRPLLPGTPECLVVVTSRDQLGGLVARHGAHGLSLQVLDVEEAHALLSQMLGAERVRAEPAAVAELAALCGYLPLALRIAAANLTAHPRHRIADYAAQLRGQDRLTALAVVGDPDGAVAPAFDLSYARLPDPARRAFRLVGLAPGPDVTAEVVAAMAATTADQAGRLLDLLADAHLVEEHTAGRYTCHDLLRRYAADRAAREEAEPERDAAVDRLVGWYLHATDAAAAVLFPQMEQLPAKLPPASSPVPARLRDPVGAQSWLEAEWTNLVAAITYAAEHGPRGPACLLADYLRGYCWQSGHAVDALTIATAALAAARHEGDLPAQAAALVGLGDASQRRGRYQQALEHYAAAEKLAREAGWVEGLTRVLGNCARVDYSTGRLDRAAERLNEALAVNRRAGRRGPEASDLNNLGLVYEVLGQLRLAAECHTQALAVHREGGMQEGEATVLTNLGKVAHHLGQLDEAADNLTRALSLRRKIAHRYGEANALHYLAAVHRDAGRYAEARQLAQAAVRLAGKLGDTRAEAEARNTLATVYLRLRHPERALADHRQALDLAGRSGDREPEIAALLGLAAAHHTLGHHDDAHRHAVRALRLAQEWGYALCEGQALTVLAGIHLSRGDPHEANEHAHRAIHSHQRTGHRLGQARTHLVLAEVLHQTGDTGAARDHRGQARTLLTAIGAPE